MASVIVAVVIGPVKIPFYAVWKIILFQALGGAEGEWTRAQFQIIWLIRLPRVLLAAGVGAGLAVLGVVMQTVVRNRLADPFILGVSSGASVGAVTILLFSVFSFAGIYAVSFGAFLGSLVAFVFVYLLAYIHGRVETMRLILAGLGVSYFCSGITSFIILTSHNQQLARSVLAWLLGSLSGARWIEVSLLTTVMLAAIIYLLLQSRALNALSLGEESATILGVNTQRFRRELFVVISLAAGVIVAVSGTIAFVGLMIPHAVRLIVGSDHRLVLPVSLLIGAIFLIWIDLFARILFHPVELPVGVITSALGGPFFLWLLSTPIGLKRRETHI
ncbi:iron ABC transporter permease [bacterium]|nr:iron ABC transporter permease [bacterium]